MGKQLQETFLFPEQDCVELETRNLATKTWFAHSYLGVSLSLGESTTRITQIHMSLALAKDSVVGARSADEFGSVWIVQKEHSSGICLDTTLIQCCTLVWRKQWG